MNYNKDYIISYTERCSEILMTISYFNNNKNNNSIIIVTQKEKDPVKHQNYKVDENNIYVSFD